MKVRLSYNYGGDDVELSGYVTESGESFFSVTSIPTFIPSDGSTINITTQGDLSREYRSFIPDLNNDAYYLFTNSSSPTLSDFINQGVSIPLTLDGGDYVGDFIYSNPDSFNNLFIALVLKNTLSINDTAVFSMLSNTSVIVDTEMSGASGIFELDYITDAGGVTIGLEQNGSIVASTGVMAVASSGTLRVIKYTKENEPIRVIVKSGSLDVDVSLTNNDTYLSEYYIDTDNGDLSNVCSQIANTRIYFAGIGSAPSQGDIIYSESSGTLELDGGNALHVISATLMGAPSTSSVYIGVDNNGRVISSGNCTCSEVAVPVVTQPDITLINGQATRILFEATNNPTLWSIVSTCVKYELNGGVKGAIYTYTDCSGNTQRVTVPVNLNTFVCATSAPTLVSGTGTSTSLGVCTDSLLPLGLTFENGVLFGTPTLSGEFSLTVTATNCFGTSASVTVDITVNSNIKLKPLLIDVEAFSDTGASACLVSGNYTMLYHNGTGNYPEVNDMVFFDSNGLRPFTGGNYWYNMDASLYSVKVDSDGIVIEKHTC